MQELSYHMRTYAPEQDLSSKWELGLKGRRRGEGVGAERVLTNTCQGKVGYIKPEWIRGTQTAHRRGIQTSLFFIAVKYTQTPKAAKCNTGTPEMISNLLSTCFWMLGQASQIAYLPRRFGIQRSNRYWIFKAMTNLCWKRRRSNSPISTKRAVASDLFTCTKRHQVKVLGLEKKSTAQTRPRHLNGWLWSVRSPSSRQRSRASSQTAPRNNKNDGWEVARRAIQLFAHHMHSRTPKRCCVQV